MSEPIPAIRPVLPGEDEKHVTLREFEQRHSEQAHHFREMLAHERELRETISEKLRTALELQAAEIGRRLTELNHAHETAMENWAQSLPRELFIQWQDEHNKWREVVNTTLTKMGPQAASIESLETRVDTIEKLANKLSGALILLGVMGMAGVLALLLGLARLAGLLN